MWWVINMDGPLSKHLLNRCFGTITLRSYVHTKITYALYIYIYIYIYIYAYMQFSFSGYVSSIGDWEKLIFNGKTLDMSLIRVFQVVLRGGGNGKFCREGIFFHLVVGNWGEVHHANLFQILKQHSLNVS